MAPHSLIDFEKLGSLTLAASLEMQFSQLVSSWLFRTKRDANDWRISCCRLGGSASQASSVQLNRLGW
jgi:hypothetical protein